ncbi:MAG: FAD-binding oxidoreductase [Planctomycetes bacterium]|nr:FAD-binding oxidoreductase [Planctomycetota bacterium]
MSRGAKQRIAIVGAGLAGAATAYHLAGLTGPDCEVVLFERESAAGQHSSSRNAEMVRQVVRPTAIAVLANRGAHFCAEHGAERGGFRFRGHGSLLLGDRPSLEALAREAPEARWGGPVTALLDRQAAALEVEFLRDMALDAALWTPSDGVVDAAGLLAYFLREARRLGARLATQHEVLGVRRESGRVTGLRLKDSTVDVDQVVNAAGPWAGVFGARSGAHAIPFRAMRRHLFHTGPLEDIDPDGPFVWDVQHDWYLRPESGGLLLCAGDEDEVPPGIPDLNPGIAGLLHDKLSRHLPGLADLPIARQWCGLRTFAPDRNFVIGPDPELAGYFWVAGLGGHGVTTSAAVGELAAKAILGDGEELLTAFSPARFS